MTAWLWGAAASLVATSVLAAPLTPNSGPLSIKGTLAENGGGPGEFEVHATLKAGNFDGTGRITIAGQTVEGPLSNRRSYLENNRCLFYFESGRSHVTLSGPCDSTRYGAEGGRFDSFIAGAGGHTGTLTGVIQLAGGAPKVAATGVLPTAKLTCAYMEPKIGIKWGEATTYSLRFSNMASLTLSPGGTYRAASTSGGFTRQGDKIRLTSGQFAGAVGTLEPDRSGEPAVVFHIEENRRRDGVHIVDPQTTRCTKAR